MTKSILSCQIENLGKRFQREWIFRKLTVSLAVGEPVAVIGPNGSGKSTLAQIIAGHLPATDGNCTWLDTHQNPIPESDFFRFVGYAAPYLELVEEFTLLELLHFHAQFKPWLPGVSSQDVAELIQLEKHKNKAVKYFSSGMKQRVKLGLAFFSQSPCLFLDEPTANLDAQGARWYLEHVENLLSNRWVMICSNEPKEYEFAKNVIDIRQLK